MYILMDIEGTISSISFVKETLFPYASKHMEKFLKTNFMDQQVQNLLRLVDHTCLNESGKVPTKGEYACVLNEWIEQDRKHTGLKGIQGMIWRLGFESKELTGHVYTEVKDEWQKWKEQGHGLGIYSSGSVAAQKLLFEHSLSGDLTIFLDHYFDTQVGPKQEVASYKRILDELNRPKEALFLSDITQELDAAQEAGFKTCQMMRDDQFQGLHPIATQLTEVSKQFQLF